VWTQLWDGAQVGDDDIGVGEDVGRSDGMLDGDRVGEDIVGDDVGMDVGVSVGVCVKQHVVLQPLDSTGS